MSGQQYTSQTCVSRTAKIQVSPFTDDVMKWWNNYMSVYMLVLCKVPSWEWGNQICEVLEWGPPRKDGEEGEEGALEGWGGWEGGEPKLLARKVPMKEADELPINPLPASWMGQKGKKESED